MKSNFFRKSKINLKDLQNLSRLRVDISSLKKIITNINFITSIENLSLDSNFNLLLSSRDRKGNLQTQSVSLSSLSTGISTNVREKIFKLSSPNITPLAECLNSIEFENFSVSGDIPEVTFNGEVLDIDNNPKDLEIECYIKTFGNIKLSRPFYLFEDNISISISDSDGIYGNFNLSPTKIKIKKNSNIQIKIAHSSSLGNHKLTLDSFIKIKEV